MIKFHHSAEAVFIYKKATVTRLIQFNLKEKTTTQTKNKRGCYYGMKSHQHTIFPIAITHNGQSLETKVLKYTYTNREVLYKIALPSSVSPVQQCWIAKNDAQWNQIMGPEANELLPELINAIQKYEHIPMIQSKTETLAKEVKLELKSA